MSKGCVACGDPHCPWMGAWQEEAESPRPMNKAPWWWPFRQFKAAKPVEEPKPMGWIPWTYVA